MLANFKNSSANSWINRISNSWVNAKTKSYPTIIIEELYGDGEDTSTLVLKLIEEPYEDIPLIIAVIEEPYGIRLGKIFVELYGDISIVTKIFNEYYSDAVLLNKRFTLPYNDAYIQTRGFELPWDILFNPIATFEMPYGISQTEIVKIFEMPYGLNSYNSVQHLFDMPYHLMSGDSSVTSPIISVVVNGFEIDFLSVNIRTSMGAYIISCDINVPDMDTYIQCFYLADVIVTVDGQVFNFFIEKKSRTIQNDSVVFSIGTISPTAKLDVPYATPIIDNLKNGINAHLLIQNMADIENIIVDIQIPQILDWDIPGYAISINDETPLSVIRRVVNAIGGIVQTKPNGDLLIISSYPISPTVWAEESPIEILTTEADIISLTEVLDVKDGYNAFIISDQGSSTESITLEEKNIDAYTKHIKGFRVPFDDGEFDLETSGGYEVSIDKYTYPIEENMPEVENEGDSEWEIVEFIDWTGSVSKPIYSIIDWDWIQDDLRAFQISEDGTLTIIDQLSVPSESLLRIKYVTKYWQWTVTGPVDIPIQVFVPEIEEV